MQAVAVLLFVLRLRGSETGSERMGGKGGYWPVGFRAQPAGNLKLVWPIMADNGMAGPERARRKPAARLAQGDWPLSTQPGQRLPRWLISKAVNRHIEVGFATWRRPA